MKIELLKENFQKGLNIVERVVGKFLNLPILENVLIETEDNYLKLTCTDLEIGIIVKFLVKIINQGRVVTPIKVLSNFVNLLPDKKILIYKKENYLILKTQNFVSRLGLFNPEDFPIIPQTQNTNFIKIKNKKLLEGLLKVVDFTSSTLIKPELSGVFFNFKNNFLKIVASDSFRLAENKTELEEYKDLDFSFILTTKTTRELINILKEDDGYTEIYPSSNLVFFKIFFQTISFKAEVVSKIIEGEYPNYQEIIPQNFKTKILIKKDLFLNHLKTINLFSGKSNEINLKIKPEENQIILFAKSSEIGEGKSVISANIEGKPQDISFNSKFLIEGILNLKSPQIEFNLIDNENPGLLRSPEDLNYFYILMPIKNY